MWKTLLPVFFLLLTLPACSSIDKSGDITGTYELATIDGNPVPYTPPHQGGAPEILSSTLVLQADGTFRMSMTYRTTPGNSTTREFTGTYTLTENTLRFDWEGAGVTPGTLNGSVVTINNEGLLFAYEK